MAIRGCLKAHYWRGGVEGGKGNQFRQLLSWEREMKGGIEAQASMVVALCSCSCNDERRKMAIGWAERYGP